MSGPNIFVLFGLVGSTNFGDSMNGSNIVRHSISMVDILLCFNFILGREIKKDNVNSLYLVSISRSMVDMISCFDFTLGRSIKKDNQNQLGLVNIF